jgi:hypothetical protein
LRNFKRATAAVLTSALLLFGQAAPLTSSIPVAKAAGTTYYVSNSGDDGHPGTETEPFQTITHAISVSVATDTILVAPGTYNVASGEPDFPLIMTPGVALVGSGANNTIIQGDGGSQVISIQSMSTSTSTLVDGFRITGGGTAAGSGIIIHDSSPTIANNIITGNNAVGGSGGGIYINGEANPSIHDNIIENNTFTFSGGGISCDAAEGYSPTIFNNTILSNTGGTGGGGIAIHGCSPSVYDNLISGNSASFGGGINCDTSSANIYNNVIIGNSAVGGAFANGGGLFVDDSTPNIFNNTICANTAADSGGGVFNTGDGGTFPLIFNCILWGNGDDLFNCAAAYSDIEDGDAGDGNISKDPLFIGSGSYNLQSLSPCINAGASSWQGVSAPGSDILGTTRAQGTGFDMGAYEFLIPAPTLPYSGR